MLMGISYAVAGVDNVAEEVAWVVGDQPIWKSEIEDAYQSMLYEKTPIDGDPYCVIPEQIAIEKLYLHQADMDTVEISESMVNQQVESQINYYISSLGSKEKVEQIFNKSLPALREGLREMWGNRSRVQQVQRNLTKDITSTPADVRRYFSKLPEDSVPYIPRQVEVQILTAAPAIPREEIDNVKARLRDYSDRITKGESDFSTLAILYSQDPGSSGRGGELGFMGRGQLVPEYAAVAFNLNDPKKVSKIVETEFGFHIIQLIEKRGDRVNTRHILLRPRVSEKDLSDAVVRLDSLRTDIVENNKFTFEEAVGYLSHDKDTRNNRGVMVNSESGNSRFQMSELPQEVAREVNKLQPGEISQAFIMKDPKTNHDIVALVKLTNRIEGHKANLSDDYQAIKNMYEQSRQKEILDEWLAKKIKDTYIRIEDGWRECDFKHTGWIKTK
ncbi:MAG: peptidylprolyl isomerase [Duncaniella sp.]|nr:peptidylprolyl isomerase [Duncaniella sp.]MDE5919418.1 peptidylprolyl isomerase [Duncaniella sp.]MDE6170975.1 peptidylprolyl isomerase [Duncaniella sp.]MDE6326896.1 peptidylprolyl isomerase [Duncaniella sp.]MDE6466677.1 peptidylprolyl isomerase [Duncaniella sp.]